MSLSIPDMHLSPVARAAADLLLAKHPFVMFTSGRRDLQAQARAMASNIVLNRDFIRKTYLHAADLQSWVEAHPDITSVDDLSAGLLSVLFTLSPEQQRSISRHLTGDAFDIHPLVDDEDLPTVQGTAVIATVMQLQGLERFLDHEGGLCRWHAQFVQSAEV